MRPKSKVQSQQSIGQSGLVAATKSQLREKSPQPGGAELLITVSDLRKSFVLETGERLEVLRSVDLTAAANEIIAITGASGSGKSTLLQLLGGLEEPDHGSVVIKEFSVTTAAPGALTLFRRDNIGFVFQFHHLLGDLTTLENVELPLLIARVAPRSARLRAIEALEKVQLVEKGPEPIGRLSGGEQQRVAVARALITQPAVVLADEPTGNLDATTGEEIARSLVRYCREQRALVIVATHNRELAGMCDRILHIQNGKLNPTSSRPSENPRPLQL